ncbi:MAG TPA: taurine dioxygenase [Rhodospirillaceae bacterium]|nr:taurine dioxygenase [Rhodospirillaceae bacterium]
MLAINRLPGPFGAEITGLDLNEEIDEATFDQIIEALHTHAVLCIRDQFDLSPKNHVAFGARFGELEVHVQSSFNLDGFPEIYCISNCVDENGKPKGLAEAGRVWHTDLSYMQEPSRCSLLHALEVPHDDDGKPLGSTLFSSSVMAYEALSDEMKRRLKGMSAVHSYRQVYGRIRARSKPGRQGLKDLTEEDFKKVPPANHPVVIAHPYTGVPILFCDFGTTEGFDGMEQEESDVLLEELTAHSVRPEFVYSHDWRVGDLMIWDNIQTQHFAVDDYWLPQRRYMQRVTVKGVEPKAAAA